MLNSLFLSGREFHSPGIGSAEHYAFSGGEDLHLQIINRKSQNFRERYFYALEEWWGGGWSTSQSLNSLLQENICLALDNFYIIKGFPKNTVPHSAKMCSYLHFHNGLFLYIYGNFYKYRKKCSILIQIYFFAIFSGERS